MTMSSLTKTMSDEKIETHHIPRNDESAESIAQTAALERRVLWRLDSRCV
jgi:hypothetical protein